MEIYNCPQCNGTLKINHKLAVIDTDPQCEGYSCDKCGHTEWFSDCRVVVRSRLHESDISGHIMAHDSVESPRWTKLILPILKDQKAKNRFIKIYN